MLETAVLTYGPAGKRVWTTCMGVTGEALLLASAALAPMIWPQALPRAQAVMSWLLLPVPLAAQSASPERAQVMHAPVRLTRNLPEWMFEPRRIPDKIAILVDPPDAATAAWTVESGSLESYRNAAAGQWLDRILSGIRTPAVAAEAPRVHAPVVSAPARVKVGGLVKMARPVYQPAPKYPALAKAARISGTVELVGVIGVDGRLRELRVLKGHPLLVGAALEAVRQWIYEPTHLNGEPVEVEAPISVNFHLQ